MGARNASTLRRVATGRLLQAPNHSSASVMVVTQTSSGECSRSLSRTPGRRLIA